jgi:hypothetical protein
MIRVQIDVQGRISSVDDPLGIINQGRAERRRVSRVEPVNRILRMLFLLVRFVVSDESRTAAWTRTWRCRWRSRLLHGPTLGPFGSRQAAIAAEVAWLNDNAL